ncbi:hypothetical protein NVP1161O_228, partial [Vibrio phage 1.161.O._10N.261.48.C5]
MDYTYEFLKSKEIPIGNRMVGRHGEVFNKLYAMFPVDKESFKGLATPWAFRCLCGKYTVQGHSAVVNSLNMSCGCHKGSRGLLQGKLSAALHLLHPDCKVTLTREGTKYKSRDWGFKCNICNIERFTLNAWEVLRTSKQFCACSGKITCNTRTEAIEDLENKLEGTQWILQKFPQKFTNKRDCWVDVKCKICNHLHVVRFGNAYRKGCPSCANKATTLRLSKGTDWFIEKCNEVHNFKYDYSKVDYKKAREKVEIVCHDHKTPFTFWQSPDNHKNKGKGCPECKRLRLKHVGFKLARAEQNKDIYKTLNSGVYLTLVGSKIHKIGITCDLGRRNPEIRRESGLNVSTEHYRPLSLYDALHLENQLHVHFEDVQFKWDYEWAGHTECFLLSVEQQEYVKDFIDNYEVI